MYIHELQNTATKNDMTKDNYTVVDGPGGSKKVRSDMANLQVIYPETSTQAGIWDMLNNTNGDVIVAIPRKQDTGVQLSYNVYHRQSTEVTSGGYVIIFERTEGSKVFEAKCTITDNTANTLASWEYMERDLSLNEQMQAAPTATEADLKAGNYLVLVCVDGIKKLPAELLQS